MKFLLLKFYFHAPDDFRWRFAEFIESRGPDSIIRNVVHGTWSTKMLYTHLELTEAGRSTRWERHT